MGLKTFIQQSEQRGAPADTILKQIYASAPQYKTQIDKAHSQGKGSLEILYNLQQGQSADATNTADSGTDGGGLLGKLWGGLKGAYKGIVEPIAKTVASGEATAEALAGTFRAGGQEIMGDQKGANETLVKTEQDIYKEKYVPGYGYIAPVKNMTEGVSTGLRAGAFFAPTAAVAGGLTAAGSALQSGSENVAKGADVKTEVAKGVAETAGGAILGKALDVYAPKLFNWAFGKLPKNLVSAYIAKSPAVGEELFKNPDAVIQGMEGGVEIAKKTAQVARDAVASIDRQATADYGKSLEELEKKYTVKLVDKGKRAILYPKGKMVQSGQEMIDLTLLGVKTKITQSLQNFEVGVSRTADQLDFANSNLSDAEQSLVTKVWNRINNWNDLTPTGLNRLATVIKRFAKPGNENYAQANAIIYSVGGNARNYIADRVPEIAPMNVKFGQAMDFVSNLSDELGIAKNQSTGEGVRDTFKRIAQLFGNNQEIARDMIAQLEQKTGTKILAPEAGRQIAESTPESGLFGGIKSVIKKVVTPQKVAKVAGGIAKSAEQGTLSSIAKALQKLPRNELARLSTIAGVDLAEWLSNLAVGSDNNGQNEDNNK